MATIKILEQTQEIFYPVTVGQAVIFEDDKTTVDVSESDMEEIFNWTRNIEPLV